MGQEHKERGEITALIQGRKDGSWFYDILGHSHLFCYPSNLKNIYNFVNKT